MISPASPRSTEQEMEPDVDPPIVATWPNVASGRSVPGHSSKMYIRIQFENHPPQGRLA
jgi:hypothetical protein